MVFSEPGRTGRGVAFVATVAALVAGTLIAPGPSVAGPSSDEGSSGHDGPRPTRALRLAPEPGVGVAAVDVPLGSELGPAPRGRQRTPQIGTSAFSMVGFTWSSGAARLRVRVRSAGTWSSWQRAEALPELAEEAGGGAGSGRSGSELVWVGRSDAVQVESDGEPASDLEMTLIEPGGEPTGPTARPAASRPQPARAPWPRLRSRADWGADDRLLGGPPRYNRTIQQVHVHHTAGSNRYTRADVPGLIRGMYRYHTQNLGWNDIGYNFLVDRFGRTWVGRAGGPGRPVRGAHTLGFNATSTGVAVIGNYDVASPVNKVTTALVQIAAWKLDKYHRDPQGTARVYSHGSDLFPPGRRVRLPVVDGHRDTNQTACPGDHVYAKLPNIRRRAAERIARFH